MTDETLIDVPTDELAKLRKLRQAVIEYFWASDNAGQAGKTKEQFDLACDLSRYRRDELRKALMEI